jgi:hypothetical protein
MRRLLQTLAIAGLALATPSLLSASTPGHRTPEEMAVIKQIVAMLHDSGKLHHYHIGVDVDGTTVYLNGSVASREQLQAALDIVQDTPNIEKIVNGVQVVAPAAAMHASVMESQGSGRAQLALDSQPDYNGSGAMQASATSASVMSSGGKGSGAPLPLASSTAGMNRATLASGAQPIPGVGAEQVGAGQPIPAYVPSPGGIAPAHYDRPAMPGYAWPSYASYPNYAALTYPRQYSPTAWPFIGPFYPYPQVPLGWRKVSLEWHNGWWMLDFNDNTCGHY